VLQKERPAASKKQRAVLPASQSKAEAIIDMLENHGYNVELIAYLDAEDWNICGLPEEYRVRMNQSAEMWMIQQGAVRRLR
jgi:hypothetical protein